MRIHTVKALVLTACSFASVRCAGPQEEVPHGLVAFDWTINNVKVEQTCQLTETTHIRVTFVDESGESYEENAKCENFVIVLAFEPGRYSPSAIPVDSSGTPTMDTPTVLDPVIVLEDDVVFASVEFALTEFLFPSDAR